MPTGSSAPGGVCSGSSRSSWPPVDGVPGSARLLVNEQLWWRGLPLGADAQVVGGLAAHALLHGRVRGRVSVSRSPSGATCCAWKPPMPAPGGCPCAPRRWPVPYRGAACWSSTRAPTGGVWPHCRPDTDTRAASAPVSAPLSAPAPPPHAGHPTARLPRPPGCRLPTTDYRLPTPGRPPPTTDHRPPNSEVDPSNGSCGAWRSSEGGDERPLRGGQLCVHRARVCSGKEGKGFLTSPPKHRDRRRTVSR